MPHSRPNLKPELFQLFVREVPLDAEVVDIGPGDGLTGRKLRELGYTKIEAIEAHEPYVEEFGLKEVYDHIRIGDVSEMTRFPYHAAICTDVLEHLDPIRAKRLIHNLWREAVLTYFIVPWLTPQGAWRGIEWERHRQPDLTPEVMSDRYPQLLMMAGDGQKGLYVLPL